MLCKHAQYYNSVVGIKIYFCAFVDKKSVNNFVLLQSYRKEYKICIFGINIHCHHNERLLNDFEETKIFLYTTRVLGTTSYHVS